MITFLIQWEKFSFESSVNFSAVADELFEQVKDETSYLFRMIEHEWKKLQNLSIFQFLRSQQKKIRRIMISCVVLRWKDHLIELADRTKT